jgi:succinate dehydrogenase/fumarate reductase flavoprotein subunit
MQILQTDIIVVGGGGAGLRAAIACQKYTQCVRTR